MIFLYCDWFVCLDS